MTSYNTIVPWIKHPCLKYIHGYVISNKWLIILSEDVKQNPKPLNAQYAPYLYRASKIVLFPFTLAMKL